MFCKSNAFYVLQYIYVLHTRKKYTDILATYQRKNLSKLKLIITKDPFGQLMIN